MSNDGGELVDLLRGGREIDGASLRRMNHSEFVALASQLLEQQAADRREMQLLYYHPVSPMSRQIHFSTAQTVGVGGGNRSSKTETCLAHFIMCGTGVIPNTFRKDPVEYENIRAQMRGPINMRIVVESLTTTLHPIILPKLRWNTWTGLDEPGGERGHWGWIPRMCLRNGSWDKSWSEKLRTLKFDYRDPDDYTKVLGESTIQFMSYDQDHTDFASGEFHLILHDEPPKYPIWRENRMRAMSVNGRIFLAMTWPDQPEIDVDWLFDKVYEPGQQGPNKNPNIDWFNLYTVDNPNLDLDAVSIEAATMSEEEKKVRIYGQPIRFSNRVHREFVDLTQWWCFSCKKSIIPFEQKCSCGSADIDTYCHVEHRDVERYPTVLLLDPHPRKPHMFMWVTIDPYDDWHVISAQECSGDPTDVFNQVDEWERENQIDRRLGLIDPNMGRSPSGVNRNVTWQDEFDNAGVRTDTADTSDVGRKRIDQRLVPDPHTRRPRLTFEPGHATDAAVLQMKRYIWDDYAHYVDKAQKQRAKEKYDDYPTLLKYMANADPTFNMLRTGGQVLRRQTRTHETPSRMMTTQERMIRDRRM